MSVKFFRFSYTETELKVAKLASFNFTVTGDYFGLPANSATLTMTKILSKPTYCTILTVHHLG